MTTKPKAPPVVWVVEWDAYGNGNFQPCACAGLTRRDAERDRVLFSATWPDPNPKRRRIIKYIRAPQKAKRKKRGGK